MMHPFRRNRALTAGVVLTLSMGVGVSAAMINLVDVLLFRPPAHVISPDHLVDVPSANNFVRYLRLQRSVQTLDVAAYTRVSVTAGVSDPFVLRAECITHNYFQLLGVKPIIGHSFSQDDRPSDGTPPVILSHGLWKRHFAGAANVRGATVVLGGKPHTVVGVAPADFTGVRLEPVDLWLALTNSPELCSFVGRNLLSSSNSVWLSTIGRIHDTFTYEQTAAEIIGSERSASGTVAAPESVIRPLASSRRARLSRDGRMALWLAGGAVVVLMIACANVAVLLTLRGWERRLEIAVRIQLGATAKRVFLLIFVENLALSVLCIGAAVLVATWVDGAVRAFFPVLTGAHVNARSFKIIAVFALFAGLVGGIIPAAQIARSNASLLLRGGQQVIAGRSRIRSLLLVLQLALSQALLVGSGVFIRSVNNLLTDAGYDIEPVIVATVELEKEGYSIPDAWSKIDTFMIRARSIPAVVSVSASSDTLLNSGGMTVAVALRPSLISGPSTFSETQAMNAVTRDYFATLGTRIVRGRGFVDADNMSSKPVVIIDEELARAAWAGDDPLGKCSYIGSRSDCIEVIGISNSRRSTFISRVRKEFFVPAAQAAPYRLHTAPRTVFIRSSAPTRDVMPAIGAALQSTVPEIPKGNVRRLVDLAEEGTRSWRLGAKLFGLFGISAAMMAGMGLYSALALMVRQRTAEFAIRMAFGARPGTVIIMVVRHVAMLFVSGWLVGTVMILLLGQFLERMLFGVRPTDPSVNAGVTILLCAVAALGSLLPALRAVRLDPSIALRN